MASVGGRIIMSYGDPPGAPSTGKVAFYVKNDGLFYYKLDTGSEFQVTQSGAVDHGGLLGLGDDDHIQYLNEERGDARYLSTSSGVLNGNSHNHSVGDGGPIYFGTLSGTGDVATLTALGSQDPGSAGVDLIGYGPDHTLKEWLDQSINSGVLSGCVLTNEGVLHLSWTSGTIYDSVSKTILFISSGSGDVVDNSINYLKWTVANSLELSLQKATGDEIFVARIDAFNNKIHIINQTPYISNKIPSIEKALSSMFPLIITDGLLVYEKSGWMVTSSSGTYFENGFHEVDLPELDSSVPLTLYRFYHTSNVWDQDTSSGIDPTKWDNGSDRVATNPNKYYKSMFSLGHDKIHWIYPQAEYDSEAAAIIGPLPVQPAGMAMHPQSSAIVLKGDAPNFPSVGSASWIDARPMRLGAGVTSVIDHGSIIGLSDDDHTQYLNEARGDERYYTESEVDTISGTLNNEIMESMSSFLKLQDVPTSYSGEALKHVMVNAEETGLSFMDFEHGHQIGIDGEPTITTGSGANAGKFSVASVEVWFYIDNNKSGVLKHNIVESGWLVPVDDVTEYICADRDTDSWVMLSSMDSIDYIRYIPYFTSFKRAGSNNFHFQKMILKFHGELDINHERLLTTTRYYKTNQALTGLSVDTSLNIVLNGGVVYNSNYKYDLPSVTASTRQFKCTNISGTWSITSNTTPILNNTQYNTVSGLSDLTDGYWGSTYVYRGVEDQDHMYTVLGASEYPSLSLAQADNSIPNTPELISGHAIFVGRVIVQKNTTSGIICESAFTNIFSASSAISDHGVLAGLLDDDHTQYLNEARGDERYYTETEINIISGTLQSSIDLKPDSFIDLDTVPNTYSGASGYVVVVKEGEDGLEFVLPDSLHHSVYYSKDDINTISGVLQGNINLKPDTFLDLSDTPLNYSGAEGYVLAINASGTGIDFYSSQEIHSATFYTKTELTTSGVLDTRYYTETEVDTISGSIYNSIPTALSQLSEDTTHRVVTDSEKSIWSGKQDVIEDYPYIRQSDLDRNCSGLGGTASTSSLITTNSGNTTFSVGSGFGYVNNHTGVPGTFVYVTFSGAQNVAHLGDGNTHIAVDINGDVVTSTSEPIMASHIYLGHIYVINNYIVEVFNVPEWAGHFSGRVNGFVSHGIKTIVSAGLAVSEQVTPLKLNISSGKLYVRLSEVNVSSPITSFTKMYENDNVWYTDSNNIDYVNTTQWNNVASGLVTTTSGYWKKDLVLITPSKNVYYIFGQGEFASEDLAIAGPIPIVPDAIRQDSAYLALIVSRKDDTSIDNRIHIISPNLDRIFGYGTSGGGTVVDHGTLIGLGDDDHTQYFNTERGDARYFTETELTNGELDSRYYTETELNSGQLDSRYFTESELTTSGSLDSRYYTETEVNTISGAINAKIITAHNGLTGLSDDDHNQYLLTSGTRNLTGIQSYSSDNSFTTARQIPDKGYVDSVTIFGQNYSQNSSEGQSSTTSNTYQNKLTLTTASLPSGNYRINWYYEWTHSSISDFFDAQVQVNNVTTIMNHIQEPKQSGTSNWVSSSGFYYYSGISGVLTIDLDYRTSTATSTTSYIRRARLELWRIS